MEAVTSDIRTVEFTYSSDADSPVLPESLGQIREGGDIGTVPAFPKWTANFAVVSMVFFI